MLSEEYVERLNRLYRDRNRMLEIRDTDTTGLTGKIGGLAEGQNQNLVKLVFEILRTHDQHEHAETGGSWGLGKTVYYQMGVGLVIYYSRIRTNDGNHEERIVCCMVENETLPPEDRIIHEVDTGIAWWGGTVKIDDRIWPSAVTDPKLIGTVLHDLGANRFAENETGTAVLIPFLRNDLLPGASLVDEEGNNVPLPDRWYGNDEGYVQNALYKWYAARIDNVLYPHGAELKAFVNGVDIGGNMPRFYQIVRQLYNMANRITHDNDPLRDIGNNDKFVEAVSLYKTFRDEPVAGWVAAVRLTPKELGMHYPDNERSPFEKLFNKGGQEPSGTLFGYLRTPGMIVRWNDQPWIGRISPDPEGRFVIALFVPNSEQSFREDVVQRIDRYVSVQNLEQYLRSVEKADHSHWVDHRAGLEIVSRIQASCKKLIKKKFDDSATEQVTKIDMGLARFLGERKKGKITELLYRLEQKRER